VECIEGGAMSHWRGWPLVGLESSAGSGGVQRRAHNRKRRIWREQQVVLEILKHKAFALWAGRRGVLMDEAQVQALLDAIYQGAEGHAVRIRHNFLVKGLLKGVRDGLWQLPIPPRLTVLRRQPSPFTPNTFAILNQFNPLYEAFIHSLEIRNTGKSAKDREAGQLIFAAIACGAILNTGWLIRVGPAIAQGPMCGEGHLWLNLCDDKDRLRRWFADPVTGLLILRWLGSHEAEYWAELDTQRAVHALIRGYFRTLGIETDIPVLKSLPALIEGAKAWWSLRLPPYLVNYAASREIAPSLPPETWVRLYGQRVHKNKMFQSDMPFDPKSGKRDPGDCNPGRADSLLLYRTIRSCFRRSDSKRPQVGYVTRRLEVFLAKREGRLPFLLQALIEWSLALMRTKRCSTKKLKPSSVLTYLSAIAPSLLASGLDRHPKDIDWDELYEAVLEQAPTPRARADRTAFLKSFHRFLRLFYGIDPVDLETGNEERRVDANLLTPAEYIVIRSRLFQDTRYPERLRRIHVLLLTLGYRLGLRRNEAANLRLRDLQDNQGIGDDLPVQSLWPELLVRNTAHGTVKSNKSVRRLPLALLLLPEELQELLLFKRQRLGEIDTERIGNELLFCHSGHDHRKLMDRETFTPIQEAMRAVTGDPGLRFHHLRHSFANFLLLRLVGDEFSGVLPDTWWRFQDQVCLPAMDGTFAAQLLLNKGAPSSRMLYVVSQLCGHVDPKETLDSYIHLLDWILVHVRNWYLPDLGSQAQAELMDVTPEAAKVFRCRHGVKGNDLYSLWRFRLKSKWERRYADVLLKESQSLESLPTFMEVEPNPLVMERPSPMILYRILRSYYKKFSLPDIADRFGFPSEQIRIWTRTACALGAQRSTKGKLRFAKKEEIDDTSLERYPALPGLCPAPPRSGEDRQDAEDIYWTILELAGKDRRRVECGLRLFLTHVVSTESHLCFRCFQDQAAWVEFLKMIFPVARLRLTLFPNPHASIESQRFHWSRALSIPKKQVLVHPNEISKRSHGRCLVWVAQKGASVKIPSSRESKSWPAPSLKFALFLAAVCLGLKRED